MISGANESRVAVDWQSAWLNFRAPVSPDVLELWQSLSGRVTVRGESEHAQAAREALSHGFACLGAPGPVEASGRLSNCPHSSLVLTVSTESGARSDEQDVIRVCSDAEERTLVVEASEQRLLPFAAYWLLRYLQNGDPPPAPGTVDQSSVRLRAISQWDNLDRTIERGYAGLSFFDWRDPSRFAERQRQYGRLLCAAGINTVFLNNVNASPEVLTEPLLHALQVFADRLRPFGIRVGIAVNFGSPVALGELETADPLEPAVRKWWEERARRIYQLVPDLVGLLVKANSEGQPGPQDYGRGHADGANMLAAAVEPYGALVYWRAFVYRWNPEGRPSPEGHDSQSDSFHTFAPLDGAFADNVVVVIKNGPVDFQVREPLHPLLSAMPRTHRLLEFQVTQEYTGQDVHLCFLPSQWAHYLSEPINDANRLSHLVSARQPAGCAAFGGLVGVSAWGDSACWSGHPLAQANLYGLGRLAWNPDESPERIARDWTAQTFGTNPQILKTVVRVLLSSWPAYEAYTSPLGLGMMHCKAKHLDPAPLEREYAHRADSRGIGRDRCTATGSGFAALYQEPLRSRYENMSQTDEALVLMFHRLRWDQVLPSGLTVADALEAHYKYGLIALSGMKRLWDDLADQLEPDLHSDLAGRFAAQEKHAHLWARTMVEFFADRRTRSG